MTGPIPVPWSLSEWRCVVVYGLGLSGLAALRFLRSKGISVVAVDQSREVSVPSDEATRLVLGEEDPELPDGVDAVVTSPGVPGDRLLLRQARAAGVPVLSEVELAFPFLRGAVVGITGSNGKSTTAAMTAAIFEEEGLEVELCGNIGEPLSARIEGPAGRVFVVELSSFQLEEVSSFKVDNAALLNLSPDHLDRYRNFDDYVAAKQRIFERQTRDSTAVLNADDGRVVEIAAALEEPHVRFFSRRTQVEDGCYLAGGDVIEVAPGGESERLFSCDDLHVSGLHNVENAMAASLLARSRNVGGAAIRRGLRAFRGLPHRLERVRDRAGVVWYDDSKGTNVGATQKSLEGFCDHTVHLILGGRAKGGDPASLRETVRRKARHLYFIGESAAAFEEALGGEVAFSSVGTLEKAISCAAENARVGEVVLLSPACSSFDQFRSFEHRGERFQTLVRALNGEALNGESGGETASL